MRKNPNPVISSLREKKDSDLTQKALQRNGMKIMRFAQTCVVLLSITNNCVYGMYTKGLFDNPLMSIPMIIHESKLPKYKCELYEILCNDDHQKLCRNSCARATPNTQLGNYTLLTCAAAMRRNKCAHALITECSAQVNKLDNNKLSPLVYALKHENWELAELLLEYGASVHLLQGDGYWGPRSPLWIFFRAIFDGHYNWAERFTRQIEWLLRHGANPSMDSGGIPLGEVNTRYDKNISVKFTKLLCEYGADVTERRCGYQSVLHDAVQRRPSDSFECQILIIHYLLQAGADINAQDEHYYTPLHNAVRCNEDDDRTCSIGAARTNADCIAYLIVKGANPELANSSWHKPIYYARQPEVIAMLENPEKVTLPERVKRILDPLKVPCEKIP